MPPAESGTPADEGAGDVEETEDREESDLVYETVSESPIKRWVLLDGNRLAIAAALTVLVLLSVVALDAAAVVDVRDDDAMVTLLSALVGGTLPFITIVLAINQLVLSQELGWTAELQSRFRGMASFRRSVEDVTDTAVTPASPADFLRHIVEATNDRARSLPPSVSAGADPALEDDVRTYADALAREGEEVAAALEDVRFGTFDALAAVLGHHQGPYLHGARQFRANHGEKFDDVGPLEELIELLEYLDVARQTFKTLYVQHELAVLSRLLLYVGFPTLVGGGLLILAYPTLVGSVRSDPAMLAIAAGGVTLVFMPFVVLLSYALRIATIAARTADFGPFVPGE